MMAEVDITSVAGRNKVARVVVHFVVVDVMNGQRSFQFLAFLFGSLAASLTAVAVALANQTAKGLRELWAIGKQACTAAPRGIVRPTTRSLLNGLYDILSPRRWTFGNTGFDNFRAGVGSVLGETSGRPAGKFVLRQLFAQMDLAGLWERLAFIPCSMSRFELSFRTSVVSMSKCGRFVLLSEWSYLRTAAARALNLRHRCDFKLSSFRDWHITSIPRATEGVYVGLE